MNKSIELIRLIGGLPEDTSKILIQKISHIALFSKDEEEVEEPVLKDTFHKTIYFGEKNTPAKMFLISSSERHFIDYNYNQLFGMGLEFLDALSDESFLSRFDAPKPNTDLGKQHIIDHFLSKNNNHTMLLVTDDTNKLIAAATLFNYDNNAILQGHHIAEKSITVSDEYQGKGLGKLLDETMLNVALGQGLKYLYFSFTKSNDRSRILVDKVMGPENIVIGKKSLTDKIYKIPGADIGSPEQQKSDKQAFKEFLRQNNA